MPPVGEMNIDYSIAPRINPVDLRKAALTLASQAITIADGDERAADRAGLYLALQVLGAAPSKVRETDVWGRVVKQR